MDECEDSCDLKRRLTIALKKEKSLMREVMLKIFNT